MIDPEFVKLRDRAAKAKREHRDVGKHEERLRAHTHDCLMRDVCLRAAQARTLEDLSRIRRQTRTLLDTLAFGETGR